MRLIIQGKPKHTLTAEIEAYARRKLSKLDIYLPQASTVEVALIDERGKKGGVDRKVNVTIIRPGEKDPIHLEEISDDFRVSIDLIKDRAERTLREIKEKKIAIHRRMIGKSQEALATMARQTATIPTWIWKTIRRQLSRRGW